MIKTKLRYLVLTVTAGLVIVLPPVVEAQFTPRFEACHAAAMAILSWAGREAADAFFDYCMGL